MSGADERSREALAEHPACERLASIEQLLHSRCDRFEPKPIAQPADSSLGSTNCPKLRAHVPSMSLSGTDVVKDKFDYITPWRIILPDLNRWDANALFVNLSRAGVEPTSDRSSGVRRVDAIADPSEQLALDKYRPKHGHVCEMAAPKEWIVDVDQISWCNVVAEVVHDLVHRDCHRSQMHRLIISLGDLLAGRIEYRVREIRSNSDDRRAA
jgi:hypothetical protein